MNIEIINSQKKPKGLLKRRSQNKTFCSFCKRATRLTTPIQASLMLQTTVFEIKKLTKEDKIHLLHNKNGEVKICVSSLKAMKDYFFNPRIIVLKPVGTINENFSMSVNSPVHSIFH